MPAISVDAAREWRSRTHDVSRTVEGRIDRPDSSERPDVAGQPIHAEQPSPAEPDDAPQPGDTADYRRARAEREKTRAQREALELEQLRGKLIDVDEASRMAFTAFRGLRDALENVAPRIKDQVAAENDAFRAEQIIGNEIASVLSSFDVASAVHERDDEDEE
jgi:hypothetical protein